MASININRLTNGNVYGDGLSLLGKVEEITLPALKAKDVAVKALGLQMDIMLPGGFEAMAGKMKLNAVYPEFIAQFSSPYVTKQIQVRCNMETYDSSGRISEVAVVAYLTIRFKDVLPAITIKQNDNPDQESEFNCSYFRLESNGVRIVEIDAFNNMFFIMDRDEWAQYRINLGF